MASCDLMVKFSKFMALILYKPMLNKQSKPFFLNIRQKPLVKPDFMA